MCNELLINPIIELEPVIVVMCNPTTRHILVSEVGYGLIHTTF
jgi:hypothetical protein